jgi:hypothetical protein
VEELGARQAFGHVASMLISFEQQFFLMDVSSFDIFQSI